jgi:hypothetical protein
VELSVGHDHGQTFTTFGKNRNVFQWITFDHQKICESVWSNAAKLSRLPEQFRAD